MGRSPRKFSDRLKKRLLFRKLARKETTGQPEKKTEPFEVGVALRSILTASCFSWTCESVGERHHVSTLLSHCPVRYGLHHVSTLLSRYTVRYGLKGTRFIIIPSLCPPAFCCCVRLPGAWRSGARGAQGYSACPG
jgi:hypothetical protein